MALSAVACQATMQFLPGAAGSKALVLSGIDSVQRQPVCGNGICEVRRVQLERLLNL